MDGWWSHPPHRLLSDSTWLWVIVSGQAAQTMSSLTTQLQALMLLGPVNGIRTLRVYQMQSLDSPFYYPVRFSLLTGDSDRRPPNADIFPTGPG